MKKVIVVVILAVFLSLPFSAFADGYDEAVFDGAGLFSAEEHQALLTAADGLADRANAEVHIVTLTSVDGELEDFFNNVEDWKTQTGNLKPDLLVFYIVMESRDVGVLYGDVFREPFNYSDRRKSGDETKVWQAMGTYFANGDFAGGFLIGMKLAEEIIYSSQHPVESSQPTRPESQPTIVVNSPKVETETDRAVKQILLVVLLIAAVATCVIIGIRKLLAFLSRLREARERLEILYDRIKDPLELLRCDISEVKGLVEKYEAIDSKTGPELSRFYDSYLRLVNGAHEEFYDQRLQAKLNRALNDFVFMKEYESLEKTLTIIVSNVKEANDYLVNIEDRGGRIDEDLEHIQKKFTECKEVVSEITNLYGALPKDLKIIPKQKDFEKAKGGMDKLRAQKDDGTISALAPLKKQHGQLTNIHQFILAFSEQIESLKKACPKLDGKIAKQESRLLQASNVLEDCRKFFAGASWQAIASNCVLAKEKLDEAKIASSEAQEAFRDQCFDTASEKVASVDNLVGSATGLLDDIISCYGRLSTLKDMASKRIGQVEASIQKTKDYIGEGHEGVDVKAHSQEMSNAEDLLAKAKREVGLEKPDYVEAEKMLQSANDMATDLLGKCVAEYDQAKQLKSDAKKALEEAIGAVNEAKDYIKRHSSSGSKARREMEAAEESLRRAQNDQINFLTAMNIISLATQTRESANKAHSAAKRAVSAASGSSYSGISGSFGGGSGGSFGSGFGGGGSGGSFGGGFGGGGSGGKW